MTPSAPTGRRRTMTKGSKGRDLEGGGLATGDVGLPSCVYPPKPPQRSTGNFPDLTWTFYLREIFARTRRNEEETEQVIRSSSDDPSDFKTPASPSHYSPTSVTHPVILTLSDKGENQAGASGSIASSFYRPDTSPLLLPTKGYYPYDDRGRRAISPDSRPSTGD